MKISRWTRGVALLAALAIGACASNPSVGDTGQRIRELEQQQVVTALSGDRAALERIFAPHFRLINPSGAVANRDELLTMLTSGNRPYSAATYTTESVLVYGRVVVTTGIEEVQYGTGAQAGQRQRRRVSQTWERRGQTWQLVLRHATIVAPPP